jgi:hyperosmotically inducible periplasmic protein
MKIHRLLLLIPVVALLGTPAFAQTTAPVSASQSLATTAPSSQATSTKKAERLANRALAKRVRQTLYKTKGLDDADIVVFANAKSGQITLAGFVLTEDQDHIASAAVSKVQGVTSVTSKLTLQEQGS